MAATDRLLDLLHLGPKTAVVVHDPSNMFYLTEGYSREGLVYILAERRVIVTDFPTAGSISGVDIVPSDNEGCAAGIARLIGKV